MTEISTKRRNILIASIIVVALASIGAVVIDLSLSKDIVTVSGKALVNFTPATNIQAIEFTDTQTGTTTTFNFTFAPQSYSNLGNYSVTLKNGHAYNVYISFYVVNPENLETHFSTTFYVNSTAGQTAITRNFRYPD